jgi:hypothetical protein
MAPSPYDGPEYARLLAAARRSLERTSGDLTGSVSVRNPDDAERRAIIGITGQYRPEGVAQLTVRLAASLPLICTEGRPSTAFHRLAAAVTGGGELRYHGDFDWPGVSIAGSVIARHGAVPWRFGAPDYLAGVRSEGDFVALSGPAQPTPWDPSLAAVMTETGRVVYEESVADALIADMVTQ